MKERMLIRNAVEYTRDEQNKRRKHAERRQRKSFNAGSIVI
jgi:hypothetical protein